MGSPGPLPEMKGATFSPCRKYRYGLWRIWSDAPPAVFIGLNPSTADETENDPTVRRCIDFARRWGCGGLVMLNLFAYRATDPKEMKRQADPVGPENDEAIMAMVEGAAFVICAWGAHGGHRSRAWLVKKMLQAADVRLQHLGLTKEGWPRHPLYLPSTCMPQGM